MEFVHCHSQIRACVNRYQSYQEAYVEAIHVVDKLRRSHMKRLQKQRIQVKKGSIFVESYLPKKGYQKYIYIYIYRRRQSHTRHPPTSHHKQEREEELRVETTYNISNTGRCKGKLCNMIIDYGSAINFIAQESIDKLQLPTEKLQKPYKVAWVNDLSLL